MTQPPRSGSGRNNPRGGKRPGDAPRPDDAPRRSEGGSAQGRGRPGQGGGAGGAGRTSAGKPGGGRSGAGRDQGRTEFGKSAGQAGARRGAADAGAGKPGSRKPSTAGAGAGKPGTGKPGVGKPYGSKAAGKSGAGKARGAKPQRPAGPKAFGRERFGQNLGPVSRADRPARSGTGAVSDLHDPEGVRLQKVLAGAGVASRRVCEELIQAGRVEVDGVVVRELGVRVDPARAIIHVDGIRVQMDETLTYLVFNKPKGVVSTMEDPEGRPCISDYLKPQQGQRLFHVGRLDQATEGLLLLTNDGELANRLTHPSYEVPKTYLVQVRGPMAHGVGAQMKAGIELEDGVSSVDSFKLVDSTPGHVLVEVVLHSGKNRVVRRLFDAVGHPVERLVRIQVGPIRLGDQRQGSIRALGRQEAGHLLALVGM
ncbi:pseudouridine synthase [Arthrobacter sulfonylureivorans]|uniref:pseudouridine synthase n=1 Tax=Arthrobacter sulfonylureivorans TaxID=2486855 RepID=UPI0039E6A22E